MFISFNFPFVRLYMRFTNLVKTISFRGLKRYVSTIHNTPLRGTAGSCSEQFSGPAVTGENMKVIFCHHPNPVMEYGPMQQRIYFFATNHPSI
jgi:hypothetical protein